MITVINNHVLFAHRPNWGVRPSGKRSWQTEIANALPGGETRQALRAVARRSVTFTVTARTLPERVRLESRIDVAAKTGLACGPLHGRASVLAADANGNTLTLMSGGAWNWQAGDYAVLVSDDVTFDMAQVVNVDGNILTVGSNLIYNWPARATCCWPIMFGKFSAQKSNALDGVLAEQQITISEMTSGRSVMIGSLPAVAPGIDTAVIGSTLVVG